MLIGGIVIVCLFSFAAGFLWAKLSRFWSISCALVFPFIVAKVTYWIPLWNKENTSEYAAWYWAIASLWLVYALPVSVSVTLLRRRSLQRSQSQGDIP
jgi:hypothetical protein